MKSRSRHTADTRPLLSKCLITGRVSVWNVLSRFSIANVVSSGRLCCGSRCSSFCLRRSSLDSTTMTPSTRPTCTYKLMQQLQISQTFTTFVSNSIHMIMTHLYSNWIISIVGSHVSVWSTLRRDNEMQWWILTNHSSRTDWTVT